jgi:hypothetical protein
MLKHDKTGFQTRSYTYMKYAKSVATPILISKKGMGLWDNSRQIEVRIFEIRQKLSEQEQKGRCPFIFGRILTIRPPF